MSEKTKTGWRSVLDVHPACDLFPPMNVDELRELADDIKRNGLRVPIVLWFPGAIDDRHEPVLLDGRNRLDALELLGVPVVKDGKLDRNAGNLRDGHWRHEYEKNLQYLTHFGGPAAMKRQLKPGTDPFAFVISANIHRRHLTAEKKRELIGELLKAKPEASNLQIAKQVKADDKTVASVRREMERRSELPNVSRRTDTKGRSQPASKAAKPDVTKSRSRPASKVTHLRVVADNKPAPDAAPTPAEPEPSSVPAPIEQPSPAVKGMPTNFVQWRRDLDGRLTRAAFDLDEPDRSNLFRFLRHLIERLELAHRDHAVDLANREAGDATG